MCLVAFPSERIAGLVTFSISIFVLGILFRIPSSSTLAVACSGHRKLFAAVVRDVAGWGQCQPDRIVFLYHITITHPHTGRIVISGPGGVYSMCSRQSCLPLCKKLVSILKGKLLDKNFQCKYKHWTCNPMNIL